MNFTFGRYDPSLTGKTHRNPNETFDGAFGIRWNRTSATLDPCYREPPDDTMRPYVGPGHLDDFNLTGAQSSDPNDLGFGKLILCKKNCINLCSFQEYHN